MYFASSTCSTRLRQAFLFERVKAEFRPCRAVVQSMNTACSDVALGFHSALCQAATLTRDRSFRLIAFFHASLQMMTRINRMVAYDYASASTTLEMNEKKQIPSIATRLTAEVFFKPKRKDEISLRVRKHVTLRKCHFCASTCFLNHRTLIN